MADYATVHTRSFGISESGCYFGRSLNMKVEQKGDEDMAEVETNLSHSRKFVYTATTLRLLEQIAQALA